MSTKKDEARVQSRESVCSQLTMSDTVSAEGEVHETQRRKTAGARARGEGAMEGARERISAGVVAQSMEDDGMECLWRVLSVIEAGQGSGEEAKKVRDRVIATVEGRSKPGALKKQLPPWETGWQGYIQKTVQGRRMGGPPGVEAWAAEGGTG